VYLARKPDKRTCYAVGWTAHGSSSGVFWDVMPDGAMRVMSKCVHQAALESAGKKLRELSHGSGGRSVPWDARTGAADRSPSAPIRPMLFGVGWSDAQIGAIFDAARPLPRHLRPEFLRELAAALSSIPSPGDGDIHRVIKTTQKRFFDPPLRTG
jgi:hypothetical protein